MIEINNITKAYGKKVLKGVSHTFKKNKIYVLKGISGCGKTTLLNILGGLETDFEGEYLYEGRNVKEFTKSEYSRFREDIGYVFQSSLLMSNLTVLDNLLYINNDRELIYEYARQLKVEELLEKYPEQLSGGQRQRISVIRSLILKPKIILADEPTAALDKTNSDELAKLFLSLKSEDRIIIIATHESCFDQLADEVIHLGYGVIKDVESKDIVAETKDHTNVSVNGKKKRSSMKVLIPLMFRRQKEKYRIKSLLPLSIIILIVMICFGLQHNFKDEATRYYRSKYPMNVLAVDNIRYESFKYSFEDMEAFYLHYIEGEEFDCYPLLSKEDSVLSYGNLIKCGEFPTKDTDVIISNAMAFDYFGVKEEQECIGKKLLINDVEYTVAAVVATPVDEDVDWSIYESDVYYNSAEKSNLVYIPYDNISQQCKPNNLKVKYSFMIKIPNLYDDAAKYEQAKAIVGGPISPWDEKINESERLIDDINEVIWIAFIVAAVMATLFIKNDIEVDLFYRKKELGYMQIFGVKRSRIRVQLVLERMSKNIVCLLFSLICYNIIALMIKLITDINGFITISHVAVLFAIVLGCSFISVLLPIHKYMKKSVLELIY